MDNEQLLQAIGQMFEIELQDLKSNIQEIKSRLEKVEDTVQETKIIIENEIRRNIILLAEAHMGQEEQHKNMPADIEDIKELVSMMNFIQKQLLEKVNK